ncbi:MAG: M20/M25/M40 family metallo-hydrolase [Nitrospiraceae bacterium]
MRDDDRQLTQYIADQRPYFESTLGQMVEIPSVSMDPARAKDVRAMAEFGAQLLRAHGATAEVVETGGHPLVSGGWMTGAHHPTVTIYNHLDVQPAQEPEWRQEPFAFRNEDGVYRGRGATDDKGPALTAMLAAKFAIEQGLPINIRFLWECEEEIGSPNFAATLAKSAAIPRPDSVVISDTIWISNEQPAIAVGLRGLLAVRCGLQTGTKDAHSGVTGGAARNPLAELAEIAAACVDAKTGRVKIPGFYKKALSPTAKDVKSFLRSGFRVDRFMDAYGFTSMRTKKPADVMTRIWAKPTFEVHGLTGGYHGPGVKTVVPWKGELKCSMRLVPNQTPEEVFALFKRHVKKLNPSISVEADGMLHPFRGVSDGPYVEAIHTAIRAGFGKSPAFTREGGSIGAVVSMEKAWKVPILFLGLSLPEHGYHAPNEHFDWRQASGGMRAFATYFQRLATMRR